MFNSELGGRACILPCRVLNSRGLAYNFAHTLQQENDSENNFMHRLVIYAGHLREFFLIESEGDVNRN